MPSERETGAPGATIHSIQLLRSIAAGLVALFHAHLAFSTRVSQPWYASESYLFGFGAVGVHVFFVISGFIMVVTSFAKGGYDVVGFFRRRLIRIYPIYWLSALAYLGVHLAIGRPYALSGETIAAALGLWPGSASAIIGPAWTLSFEMYFYVCFGLAMLLGLNRGLLALGAVFAAAIAVGVILRPEDAFAQIATNSLLIEFLAGAAIGWLTLNQRLPTRGGPALVALAGALFAAGLAIGYDRAPSALVWGVPSTILIIGLLVWERRTGASGFVRMAGRLGDSSYVLYLVHVLLVTLAVEIAWRFAGPTSLAPIPAAILIATATIGVAHLLHLGIERPMLKLLNPKRALVPSRTAAAT